MFVGWAAVSSQPQASEEKISLPQQIYDNIMHGRRYGKMLCQLIVPGESRNITRLDDAENTVSGWKLTDSFGDLDGEELIAAIESKLQAFGNEERIHPYKELSTLIDAEAFDVFIFRNLGRVGRDAALSLTIVRLCQRADILTYSTSSPPQSLSGATGSYQKSLTDAVIAVGYENELNELVERHRDGMMRRVDRGLFPGRTPWGWTEIRNSKGKIDHYEINEEAARSIRLIFDMYIHNGYGERQTCDRLNELNIPSPEGKKWGRSNVNSIWEKVWRYAGYGEINMNSKRRTYHRARGSWPPIISDDVAKKFLAEQKRRAFGPRSKSVSHRFARMVFCATCGYAMIAHNNVTHHVLKSTGEHKTYSTRGYWCHQTHGLVAETKVHAAVLAAIMDILDRRNETGANVEIPPTHVTQRNTQGEIDAVNQRIAKVKAGVAKADSDLYVHGTLDADRHASIVSAAKAALDNLYSELTRLQDILNEEEHDNSLADRVNEIVESGLDMLEHPDIQFANAWLRSHFRVIATARKVLSVEII